MNGRVNESCYGRLPSQMRPFLFLSARSPYCWVLIRALRGVLHVGYERVCGDGISYI